METEEDLVHELEGLGYRVAPLAPQLFRGTPAPVGAYRVVQPDGRALALLVYDPSDAERGFLFDRVPAEFVRERPRRSALGRPPRTFQKNGVAVFVYGYSRVDPPLSLAQTRLYSDLGAILGPPRY